MKVDARIVFVILTLIWAGIVIGVSLIATPVKFQAPSLTMQAALEVGRYTFRTLGYVELCLLILTIAAATLAQIRGVTIMIVVLIAVILTLQRFWLLPYLDNQVSKILAGGAPAFSTQHMIYALLEVAKSSLLIAAAVLEYRSGM